ncbi:MAG: type III-B CRISPR-associated protein Cas10/Cmr2 [Alphaproteobacteria bacterium]|nr:MAG: type III-B CRISPR-associated protein Cas10/Cmr2 [Alphaproteobacteria bacterium]
MSTRILHFTLGPVQAFVADARRMRDFWAGSFLLSWLSGKAMQAVEKDGGTIVFPEVESDPLFKVLKGQGTPHVGSLPNRFKASVPEGFEPATARQAVLDAWQKLADAVWEEFVQPVAAKGKDTKAIWDRQVGNFWEIAWVVGPDPGDGSDGAWLDRRKNWRSHWPASPEEGDKCRLMGFWQEISGYTRLGQKAKQDAFWQAMQGEVGRLNLRQDERLCAIALIKRLFPLLENIQDVIGFRPGGKSINVRNWPSNSYVAALPWLKKIANPSHKTACDAYANAAAKCLKEGFLDKIATDLFDLPHSGPFDLNGYLLHEDGIRVWPEEDFRQANGRATLMAALKTLRKETETDAPSEFYALLKMDGDRIGALLRQDADQVKTGLAIFTRKVIDCFKPGNKALGVLIYAGGDDVLAMLPVDTAIVAAHDIRRLYDEAFEEAARQTGGKPLSATMSAAIVFAQFKVPLRQVMRVAEHQLDAIAKERNGRDSLALCALKPGGVACEWVSRWSDAPAQGDPNRPGLELVRIARNMRGADPDFAAGFFHKLRDRYASLFHDLSVQDEGRSAPAQFGDADLMKALVKAELARSPDFDAGTVDKLVEGFMRVARPLRRDGTGVRPDDRFSFDAGLMIRFLSQQGRWEAGA